MLYYAVADLHGRFDLLTLAVKAVQQHTADKKHQVVFLGDYIDRGPDSRGIVVALKHASSRGQAICLKGNHEDMMVQTLRTPLHPKWWISNGGGQTLLSYGHSMDGNYTPDVVPQEHVDWMDGLPLLHVAKNHVFVHGGLIDGHPLEDQHKLISKHGDLAVLWKLYDKKDTESFGRYHVVHGHHQYKNGPILHPGRTNLDTFAWYTGRLVVGVFDEDTPGGPVDTIEVVGKPYDELDLENPF